MKIINKVKEYKGQEILSHELQDNIYSIVFITRLYTTSKSIFYYSILGNRVIVNSVTLLLFRDSLLNLPLKILPSVRTIKDEARHALDMKTYYVYIYIGDS